MARTKPLRPTLILALALALALALTLTLALALTLTLTLTLALALALALTLPLTRCAGGLERRDRGSAQAREAGGRDGDPTPTPIA